MVAQGSKSKRLREQRCVTFSDSLALCYGLSSVLKNSYVGFPGGAVVENLPANAGDVGSSPGLGRSHMPRSN